MRFGFVSLSELFAACRRVRHIFDRLDLLICFVIYSSKGRKSKLYVVNVSLPLGNFAENESPTYDPHVHRKVENATT